MGIDFTSKNFILNQKGYKLQIWRNESPKFWVKQYTENPAEIIYCLIFDITNKESFDKLNEIFDMMEKLEKKASKVLFLLGNKADEESKRSVSCEEG